MAIVTVGIDLAKNVFAVHGVDELGNPVPVRPEAPSAKLLELIANLPPRRRNTNTYDQFKLSLR
jgi:transposase